MYDRRAVILTVVVLVLTGAAIVGIVLFTDEEPERTLVEDPAFDRAPEELDAGGEELVALLEQGREGTWHAVYNGTGPGGTGELDVEIWRSAGRVRQDSTLISDDGQATAAVFVLPDQHVSCTHGGDDAWTCVEVSAGRALAATNLLDTTDLVGTDDGDFRGVTVTPRDDVIDERPVRCFTLSGQDTEAELCLTLEGVPVTMGNDVMTIRLVTLETAVEEAAFQLPAEITRLDGAESDGGASDPQDDGADGP